MGIAPRQDAGEPSGLGVPPDAGRRPAPHCPGRGTTIPPERETRTHRRARGTIRASLQPSLPGRMPGSLARDARPTCVGWASRPMQGGVPRRTVPGEVQRSLPRERHERTAAREERSAPRCSHRSPAGCRGASRGTRDPPVWVGRPARCRAASGAALSRARYNDPPENRDTN